MGVTYHMTGRPSVMMVTLLQAPPCYLQERKTGHRGLLLGHSPPALLSTYAPK